MAATERACMLEGCASCVYPPACVRGPMFLPAQVWDMATLECVRVLEGHTEAVLALAVSSGGCLVSGSYDSRCVCVQACSGG